MERQEVKKFYQYYACCKNSRSGGIVLKGRESCEGAYKDLKQLETYIQNDLIYVGVIKCKDGKPLNHIKDI